MTHTYKVQTGLNNPILREKSINIERVDQDLIDFSKDLISYMYNNDWVGLAAPQLGKNIRIIATTQWDMKEWKEKFISETIMINPIFLWKSKEMIISEEACISLPNEIWDVQRHQSVHVEYMDIKGYKQKKKFKNFNAVVVQHEMDHLDGILFVDKILKTKKTPNK